MEDLKPAIAKNITALRKASGLTQAELAHRLNYTDKAVSKWERAESIPDIAVLKELAGMFGVTVDYMLEAEHPKSARGDVSRLLRRNRLIVILLSVTLVFSVATLLFVGFGIFYTPLRRLWIIYVDAVPAASIVVLVLNSAWSRHRRVTNCIIVSVFVWSLLLAVYLSLLLFRAMDIWLLFVIGIPAQVILLLTANLRLRPYHRRKAQA